MMRNVEGTIVDPSLWLALLTGVGVAAAAGLRAFLPLFALGLAARFGGLELEPHVRWLASTEAIACFGVATVVEILGDKIPVVDHVLDTIGTFLRPLAAWLGAYAVLVHWPTPWGQIVAILLGTGALALHALKAKLRIGSTAVTLGTANPILSLVEDAGALLLLLVALLVPVLIFVVLVALALLAWRRRRRLLQREPA
jgi:hypothetical protein